MLQLRVRNSFLATEGCFNLTRLINFLDKVAVQGRVPDVHTSYMGYWLLFLSTSLSKIELFLERVSDFIGLEWFPSTTRMVLLVESIKSISRVWFLFEQPKPVMLVHWGKDYMESRRPLPDLESYKTWVGRSGQIPPSEKPRYASVLCQSPRINSTTTGVGMSHSFTGRRTGIELGHLSSVATAEMSLRLNKSNNILVQKTVPESLLSPVQLLVIGELLYALRPMVYALVLDQLQDYQIYPAVDVILSNITREQRPYSSGSDINVSGDDISRGKQQRVQLIACFLSLSVEITSILATATALSRTRREVCHRPSRSTSRSDRKCDSQHEMELELDRRKLVLFFYLLRSPIFDRTTVPFLRAVNQTLKSVPLIGSLPGQCLNALRYLNKLHFYTSASSL